MANKENDDFRISNSHEMRLDGKKIDEYDQFLENLNQAKTILTILTNSLEKLKKLEKDIKKAVTSKEEKGFFLYKFISFSLN